MCVDQSEPCKKQKNKTKQNQDILSNQMENDRLKLQALEAVE